MYRTDFKKQLKLTGKAYSPICDALFLVYMEQEETIEGNKLIFTEDDFIEAVFLIKASSKDVFLNRKSRLRVVTGFDGDAYEEDDEGGIFKIITTAVFKNIRELKKSIEKMERYKWIFLNDCGILLNGEEIYSSGEWLKLPIRKT